MGPYDADWLYTRAASVAYQLYGEEEMHSFVREKCMDYILACRDYFKDFVDRDIDGSIE